MLRWPPSGRQGTLCVVCCLPSGSILRWTEWIDGLVLHAAEDVAYLQPRKNWKQRGRELEAACTNLVGCFAVLTLLLGVVGCPSVLCPP